MKTAQEIIDLFIITEASDISSAICALEDGECLARLDLTDEDREAIEEAHYYFKKKLAAHIMGGARGGKKAKASRANGRKGGRPKTKKIFYAVGWWFTPDGSDGWCEFFPTLPEWGRFHISPTYKVYVGEICPELERGRWHGQGETLDAALKDAQEMREENDLPPLVLEGLEKIKIG